MAAASPYRTSAKVDDRTAPPLGWTRWASNALLAIGSAIVLPIAGGLFVDTGCPRAPSAPHVGEGLLLVTLVAMATLGGVLAHRSLVEVVRRRVRVRPGLGALWVNVGVGLLVVAPGACVLALDTFLGGLFYFEFLFHLCLDGLFSFGGC